MGNSQVKDLSDKVVWIVGGSSGIGKSLAEKYHALGASVIISARTESKLEEIVENISENDRNRIKILKLDVIKTDRAEEIVNEAYKIFNKIDILILASGISCRSSFLETEFSVQEHLMKVNYLGLVALTKYTLPYLIESKGSIGVLSSIQGKVGLPNRTAYSASKHALHGFFDSLRYEVNELGVNICIFVLGYVKTNLSLNAVTNTVDSTHNKMDKNTEKGFSSLYVSKKIIKAIYNRKNEVTISQTKGFLAIWLKFFCPSILTFILKARVKEESLESKRNNLVSQ